MFTEYQVDPALIFVRVLNRTLTSLLPQPLLREKTEALGKRAPHFVPVSRRKIKRKRNV